MIFLEDGLPVPLGKYIKLEKVLAQQENLLVLPVIGLF